jgi:hypothetical protein
VSVTRSVKKCSGRPEESIFSMRTSRCLYRSLYASKSEIVGKSVHLSENRENCRKIGKIVGK